MPNKILLELRPEVAAFANLMEDTLRAHDDTIGSRRGKTGWKTMKADDAYDYLQDEWAELAQAFHQGSPEAIRAEAVDVANYLMMLLDVTGQLSPPTTEDELNEQIWYSGRE